MHICAMTHFYVFHDAFICVKCRIHMCDMTHWYVCHDVLICVPWRIDACAMTHAYVCHDAFIWVTWRIHMWAMTFSYMLHGSQTWFVYTCDFVLIWELCPKIRKNLVSCCQTYVCVWRDFLICVTWRVHVCCIMHSSFPFCLLLLTYRVSFCVFESVIWLVCTCDVTYSHFGFLWHDALIYALLTWVPRCSWVSTDIHLDNYNVKICENFHIFWKNSNFLRGLIHLHMGWLRWVGALKL